jgi:3-methyl-2-oxobutanoate hydroxymethyltransferase
MSVQTTSERVTVPAIRARKGGEPLACLTAYSAPVASLLDPIVDLLLVGDSLGMVLYGMETTLGVTVDMMIAHGRAVARRCEHACVVVDMPFASYEESREQAYRNAARIMRETGCDAVKLEGGTEMAGTIEFLVKRGIPVLAHIGLLPQSVNAVGGFSARGRDADEAAAIMADAHAVADAGAFAVVIEGTVEPLSREITAAIDIPTIGIGASPACDGQILVTDDMTGMFSDFTPRFVRRYAELGADLAAAASAYAADVRTRAFPEPRHCFGVGKPSSGKANE